jgi:hypothetical protein
MKRLLFGFLISVFPMTLTHPLYAQDVSSKLNMMEIVISNLVSRVEALEKRVTELEKGKGVSSAGSTPKMARKEPPPKESSPPAITNGFEDIGNGFFVRNVRFSPFGSNVLCIGEIANRTDKNYRFAKFILEIYDDRDLPVKKEEFTIPDLPKESVKPFEAMIFGIEAGLINRYVIRPTE